MTDALLLLILLVLVGQNLPRFLDWLGVNLRHWRKARRLRMGR